MIRILVVDDHAVVRRGLRQILAERPHYTIAGEAETGEEALRRIQAEPWDVVILDISLPDRSGLDVLKQIKAVRPELPVLVLTMHSEEQYAIRVLRAGASGYLTKESAPDLLLQAIHQISKGGRYVSPSLAERLAFAKGPGAERIPHETLSDREFQVLCMIAGGKGLTEIARDLVVSVKTISTHRTRVLLKLGLRNNAELVQYALRHGLV